MVEKVVQSSKEHSASGMQTTKDDIVKWTIRIVGGKKIGVIRLESFVPSNPAASVNDILLIIRELLVDQLKDTDCLIFDVRKNPGGFLLQPTDLS